ncbi:MAG: flippase [Candidatus Uhrbacteria bacterium]|nr:flippase [Candidatus Uhrbacteria bacterium]
MTGQVAKNALYLTIASVGQKMIAFVYFVFLARVMMPDMTGQYFLALSITMIYSVIAEFGITSVTTREIAKDPTQARRLIPHALALKLPLMTVAVIGAILTGRLLGYESEVQTLIVISSLVLVIDALQVFFYGVLRGFQVLQYEAVGIFSGMMTTAVLGGLVLVFAPSLPLLVVALIAGSSVNLLVSSSHVAKRVGWSVLIPRWSGNDARLIMRMAFPFALAAIFVKVYSYIDSIFISKFLDTTAVGLYAIAYKFTYAFQFLPLAFIAALYPGMSAVAGKDEVVLNQILLRSMWYMAILSAPIVFGLYAIAPEAILLAGDGYAGATAVLQTLVFVLIPIFLDFPIGALLNASGKQTTKTAIMGVTMVINIVLNAVLIPQVGILGAGYAALASFVFMFAAGLYFIPTVLPTFSFIHLLRIILPIYLVGIVMLVTVLVLKPIIGWILIIPVAGAVYLGGLLLTKSVKRSDLRYLKHV